MSSRWRSRSAPHVASGLMRYSPRRHTELIGGAASAAARPSRDLMRALLALGFWEWELASQVADGTGPGGELGAAAERPEFERHQQLTLQRGEPLRGGREIREVAGEPGHLCSPCPADRSEPAAVAKIGQPAEVGVGQHAQLDGDR